MSVRRWVEAALLANRRRLPVRFGVRVADWWTSAVSGAGDWNSATNGEAAILKRLADSVPPVVFDVGANVGDWTRLATALLTSATVHAFEPVPATYAVCVRSLEDLHDRVVLNDFGLSNQRGAQAMFVDPTRSTVASMISPPGADATSVVNCSFLTGDEYCAMRSVDSIDFLKIDAEGADHLVLAGFAGMIERRAVRVIQFEHGPWAFTTHSLLFDKYSLLETNGYIVGRLFPNGVEFRPFTRGIEDFRLANYVAVRSDDPLRHLLAALR